MHLDWGLRWPEILLTLHGGETDFQVTGNVNRILQRGVNNLLETAEIWIFTNGLNAGAAKHFCKAIEQVRVAARMAPVIGICSFELLKEFPKAAGTRNTVIIVKNVSKQKKAKFEFL